VNKLTSNYIFVLPVSSWSWSYGSWI